MESACFTVPAHMTQAGQEGKGCMCCWHSGSVCLCVMVREGGRELVRGSVTERERERGRKREGGSVSQSTDRTEPRRRERLKLLVER